MQNIFNVRVYGLIINERNELLVSDEFCQNRYMTKFPGGGLEFGEGLIDGLKREFIEECGQEVEVLGHFYTTDFFVESMFRGGGQLISIYYKCRFIEQPRIETISKPYEGIPEINDSIAFRWVALSDIAQDDMSFPVDKHVVGLLKKS
ncbi:MAG: NUDIX domain-containing protein [Bacteroidia bacterium]